MDSNYPGATRVRSTAVAFCAAALLIGGFSAASAQGQAPAAKPAQAQAKQAQPKQAQPKAGQAPAQQGQAAAPQGGQAPQGEENAWVKLCDKVPQADNKEICLTHHERLDGNSGMVLVAAAIRKVEGQDVQHILVTIPTAIALAIPAGVQLKIDEEEPMAMKYSFCYATSCQAEAEASAEMIEKFKKGKQVVIAAMNMQRKAVGFPVPLTGFSKAYDGAPIDSAKYQQAREQLMKVIAGRQQELAQKAAEAQKNKAAGAPVAGAPAAQPQAPAAAAAAQ
jgi:invasion protein IalB